MEVQVRTVRHQTDVLIIGGGTAGCLAAATVKELNPTLRVMIMEKAHIERSGCLAAGMNAINAYLNPGETPESFTQYVRYDAMGLLREDLVYSGAQELNAAVQKVESWGLPVQKDESGRYQPRGRWNIRINGESLKPILAAAVREAGVQVLNRVNAVDFLIDEGRVVGAAGVGVRDGQFHWVTAKAVLCCTGGAAGLYRPNNPGRAAHKMWYPPFNTGGGYAMGIRAGAEFTGFEMRFIALRTKDLICPTGTLALGFGAKQRNALGEEFMKLRFKHQGGEGAPTCLRVYGPVQEQKAGRGPCYLDTRHLDADQVRKLKAAYLDMYPGIVLQWAANEFNPAETPVEICGTEPYIMGGHCQAGYWIDRERRTTLPGLYAAGDVAGGYPYKFVSGCWAEGIIAARAIVEDLQQADEPELDEMALPGLIERSYRPLARFRDGAEGVGPAEAEERLQKIMDEYAGGISTFYEIHEAGLDEAGRQLARLERQLQYLVAADYHELLACQEVIDRVAVARQVVEHLAYRKETRWPGFQTRTDYPERDDFNWLKFVNSVKDPESGAIRMLERPYVRLIPGERYLPR
ncbi:dissimilatory adenylylsulfate reductase alpha subunit precursor [Hydrogenispora ethanolica]|uniref:Dissimilatory adenylylsulfate reductase alpha subunit n=1 Tax=Hydrogenispora ethanolica TaxID=1082276 RepID=A0A4R1SA51_HYDET|nr:dissimilatory adenylylsulfate reductase alpha subunit precursor [Hydrogenispora ethanolica]